MMRYYLSFINKHLNKCICYTWFYNVREAIFSQAWYSSVSAENPEISIWTGIVKDLIGTSLTIFAFYFLKKEHILGINLFFTSRKTRPINERAHKTKFRI